MTNLDDLKNAWNDVQRQLERQNALSLAQLKESKLARFRSGLQPLVLGQIALLIIGAVITAVSAQFWISHLGTISLVICGLLLHAYGILFIVCAVRDLVLIRRIDYGAPILAIQKQLAQLRAWHIQTGIWHGLAGSVMWLPVLIVLLHAMGADQQLDNPRQIIWLITSALVCLALNYGLLRLARSPGKCGRAMAASWIGRSVRRAQAMLDEIEEFERDLA